MRVRGVSWVGVKTSSFGPMRQFFAGVAGLPVDFERADFAVFRFPGGDKLELFGPAAGEPPGQFAVNQVEASLLVADIETAVAQLRAADIELVGDLCAGSEGYAWQHFRLPDGKVFELTRDPLHP